MTENTCLTIAIPVFSEGKQLGDNLACIRNILKKLDCSFKFLIVDDGSTDNTWEVLTQLRRSWPELHAVRFSRNFGKEAAICAALSLVESDVVIIMDSDLQHPPELIPNMFELWKNNGYKVVEAVKVDRGKEKLVNKIGAKLFYFILNNLSGYNLSGDSDYKLLDRQVIDAWRKIEERHTFFRGMSAWIGFEKTKIPFEVPERSNGTSRWSFTGLMRLALNAVTSFSTIPLHIVTFLGIALFVGSVFLGIQTLYMKFVGKAVSGFATIILLNLIIGSGIMISLGVIGEYIARIYEEVKHRPRYLIAEKVGFNE